MARKNKKFRGAGSKTVSIIVDGETEQWYTESMKQAERMRGLKIKPDLPKKKTLTQLYSYVAEQTATFDLVIWIIDMDVPIYEAKRSGKLQEVMAEFKRQRILLRELGVTVIVNSPSLERWFLLHFEDSQKYYAAQKQLIAHLRKHYLNAYEKKENYFKRKDGSLYQDLKPGLPAAIQRSRDMDDFDPENPEKSVCEMWKLFDALNIKVIDPTD